MEYRVLADGLGFPEGPIALPNGDVLFVEIARGTLCRWSEAGGAEVVATVGGGPNGAALGPDGAVYICNNGGFEWQEMDGILAPIATAKDYAGGRIDRVDLATGDHEVLYSEVDGHRLSGPNDIVFDRSGGFWFTDLGKSWARHRDHGGVYYALPDGSSVREVIYPLDTPNGIGLSADEKTLYVALTAPRVLLAFDVTAPGAVAPSAGFSLGRAVGDQAADHLLDSLALQIDGKVCVGTLVHGGITVFDPSNGTKTFAAIPESMATNICFGGADMKTAFITASTTGQLIETQWPVAGLKPNFSGL
ncbi:MAG: SMP-30/gluconolactonase/LRE family protein [Pseudomonadota bacterium]